MVMKRFKPPMSKVKLDKYTLYISSKSKKVNKKLQKSQKVRRCQNSKVSKQAKNKHSKKNPKQSTHRRTFYDKMSKKSTIFSLKKSSKPRVTIERDRRTFI